MLEAKILSPRRVKNLTKVQNWNLNPGLADVGPVLHLCSRGIFLPSRFQQTLAFAPWWLLGVQGFLAKMQIPLGKAPPLWAISSWKVTVLLTKEGLVGAKAQVENSEKQTKRPHMHIFLLCNSVSKKSHPKESDLCNPGCHHLKHSCIFFELTEQG